MEDIFEAKLLCNRCNTETEKDIEIKDGFKLRIRKCPSCTKKWYHPSDIGEKKRFERIRSKTYQVKLRMVGNSYAISIPREIIDFHEQYEKDFNKLLSISLEEPEKISIFFSKRIKSFFD